MPAFPYLFVGTIFKTNLITIAMILFSGLILLIILLMGIRKMDMRRPSGLQNFIEWLIDFTTTLARDTTPDSTTVRFVLPLAFVMIFFLFIANWLGLIATVAIHLNQPVAAWGISASDLVSSHGEVVLFDSPTANMSMTLGLAVMVWLLSHARGLRHPKQYFKHFVSNPMAIIEEITNPLTHGMRLFGNIFAGEALIGVIISMPMLFGWLPTGIPFLVIWLLYSTFVSTIQAYVFTILMSLYVGQKSYGSHSHH